MTYEEWKVKCDQPGWKFKVVCEHFKNIQYINPLKQQKVYDIIGILKRYDKIKNMYIFGSSIRSDCRPESDIDLCLSYDGNVYDEDGVYIKEINQLIREIRSCAICDVIFEQDIKGSMIEKDVRNGVLVYVHDGEEK